MKYFKAFVLFISLSYSLNLQAQSTKTIEITKTQIVNASADVVWEQIRKLDNLEHIMPDFVGDSWLMDNAKPGVGVKRSCSAPGVPKGEASFIEQIIEFSDDSRHYSYEIIQGIPAKNMVNSWQVVDLGYKKSMIIWMSSGGEFIENPQMKKEEFVAFLSSAGDAIVAGVKNMHE